MLDRVSKRFLLASLLGLLSVLAGCGASTIESALNPTRFVVYGDGLNALSTKYTVTGTSNDTDNIWVEKMATTYGLTSSNSSQLISFAEGGASLSVVENQIANNPITWGTKDVAVINGGMHDVVNLVVQYKAGDITKDVLVSKVKEAGQKLGILARRLVDNGASYVLMFNNYNLGLTPWGKRINEQDLLKTLSTNFNDAMLVEVVDQGKHIFMVDLLYDINLVAAYPASYALTDVTQAVCALDTSTAGTQPVTTSACTAGTLITDASTSAIADYTKYLFADELHFTPAVQRQVGSQAYSRLRYRW